VETIDVALNFPAKSTPLAEMRKPGLARARAFSRDDPEVVRCDKDSLLKHRDPVNSLKQATGAFAPNFRLT
jgi:hypothetical protein